MSDDPTNLINVEDDAPEAPPAPPAEPPAEPPKEPAAAEVEAVEVGGEKYVPLAAVIAERREKQTLKERAAKADELERTVNEMRPYVEFLRQNQGLMQPRAPEPAPAPAPEADPAVEQYARDFDLYTTDGKPDVQRASRILEHQRLMARQEAERMVKPVQQSAAQQQSLVNYQRAVTAKLPDGRQVDPNTLGTLWRSLPAELTADQNVAVMLSLMAAGAMSLTPQAPKVAAPANAPLVTEAPGGGRPATKPLTGLERRIVSARGMSEEQYHKLTDGFKPGRPNVLEDD